MTEKSFVMVSLKEDKAKELSKTLSNDTAIKILNYLATKKHATETQISKELQIPISTVHYNLKQLSKNKLVITDEYHYSEKGKEIIHYKIANRYIIIAPEEDEKFLEKLKSFIPVVGISVAVSAILYFFSSIYQKAGVAATGALQDVSSRMLTTSIAPLAESATYTAETDAANMVADEIAKQAAPIATQASQDIIISIPAIALNNALWFLGGAILAILILIVLSYIKHKKNKK